VACNRYLSSCSRACCTTIASSFDLCTQSQDPFITVRPNAGSCICQADIEWWAKSDALMSRAYLTWACKSLRLEHSLLRDLTVAACFRYPQEQATTTVNSIYLYISNLTYHASTVCDRLFAFHSSVTAARRPCPGIWTFSWPTQHLPTSLFWLCPPLHTASRSLHKRLLSIWTQFPLHHFRVLLA
jgi:hypothetical protein